jgi:hypothetical protein
MPDASADAAASAFKQRRVIITMSLQQHWTTGKHSWTGRRCVGVATIAAGGSGHPQDGTATETESNLRNAAVPDGFERPLHVRRPSTAISWHFERDPIPYALETDWPVRLGLVLLVDGS